MSHSSQPVIKSELSPSASGSLTDATSLKPAPSPTPPVSTPQGSYTDFVLRSSAPGSQTGWKYNVMKFAALANKSVDPLDESEFVRPLRLNRKDPRTVRRLTDQEREKIKNKSMGLLDQDGNLIDQGTVDGVKKEGEAADAETAKEAINPDLVGTGVTGALAPQQQRQKKHGGRFEKKIKRVFVSSEESRRLRREEWQPWVLEDDEGNERWIGRLEGGASERSMAIEQEKKRQELENKGQATMAGWRPASEGSATGGGGSSYVAFVFGPDGDEFQVVPIHRWYKFSQGPKYVTLGNDEAEAEYERQQKSHEAERWMMHKRNPNHASSSTGQGSGPSSGAATPHLPPGDDGGLPPLSTDIKPRIKRETSAGPSTIRSRLLDKSELSGRRAGSEARSAAAGRPKLRSVDTGGRAENDDDELYGRKRGDEGRGQDQDDDEFDYDEEFQDDEEGVAKIDDLADEQETKELEERIRKEMRAVERAASEPEEDDDDEEHLTATGKDLKRLVRKQDQDGIYGSDDDDDLSSSDSSVAEDDDSKSVTSASGDPSTPRPASQQQQQNKPRRSTDSIYRTHSSSSSRPHSTQTSRHPSRAASPSSGSALLAKRATSPTRSNPGSRATSPNPSGNGANGKRKRDDHDGFSKRRALSPSAGTAAVGGWDAPSDALIEDRHLIDFFKTKASEPNKSTTKEVLNYFRRQLKGNEKNKERIKGALHNVASMQDKFLVLKAGM
ncbi:BZ3500_MvSof-1268-A1-R1_Chr5-2g07923 [Microbotryum saponariae]|uniref:Transcription initiation factor IIF subunit alpha n=1 Tax=Microbotryum saponariae TaxID=289078 RepID=A0A2X0ML76_9BASI|nr:BZ3500_MvSof-1268-A1-R1_Chr5-2g07923 [Microbotryum saponariae]SDA05792.1 BZ3501_MvSof-1269-A2-R1_Chr5-2g07745 [Microbotryum saponariae]